MPAGGYGAPPMGGGQGGLASGDQRSLGRAAFARHMRSGAAIPDDETAFLRYVNDVGRGVPPKPRAQGFGSVVRR